MGRSPGVGNGNPLQYSCLENSMDRGAWQAIVHGVAKSGSRLNNQHFHFTSSPDSGGNTQPVTLGCWCRNASAPFPSRGLMFTVSLCFPAGFSHRHLCGNQVHSVPFGGCSRILITCPPLERCSLDSPDKPFILALCLRICLWKNRHSTER